MEIKAAESLLRFIEARDVLVTAARVLKPTPVFLRVEGAGSTAIIVDGGDLTNAALRFRAGGARENSVKLRS